MFNLYDELLYELNHLCFKPVEILDLIFPEQEYRKYKFIKPNNTKFNLRRNLSIRKLRRRF